MVINMLGTGNLAVALGKALAPAGHSILFTGRSAARMAAAAERVSAAAASIDPSQFAEEVDVVVIAIAWDGLADALRLVGAEQGTLARKMVIDCTNAVDYATGNLLLESGSAAEFVAGVAAGAQVVKALHLFAGASWPYLGQPQTAPVIAICGDDAAALDQTASLVKDLGARVVVVGGLNAARQAEEAAGFVMRLAAAGVNPRYAIPDLEPSPTPIASTDQ